MFLKLKHLSKYDMLQLETIRLYMQVDNIDFYLNG